MNVAITGASGFIGRALLMRLLHNGNDLPDIGRVLALSTSEEGMQKLKDMFPSVEVKLLGDLRTSRALMGIDALVHAGWSTVPATAQQAPLKDHHDNVEGGLRLLEAAAQAGLKRFIFLSSGGAVYGVADAPVDETWPTAPLHFYGASKLCFEHYLSVYARNSGFEHLSLRPSNVYGDLLVPTKPQGVIEHWLDALKHDRSVEVWGRMDVVRDFMHIDDLVDVLVASLHRPLAYSVMNVGTGTGTSLSELARLIARTTGSELRMDQLSASPALVPFNVLKADRVQESFGPREWISLPEGLERLWTGLTGGTSQ